MQAQVVTVQHDGSSARPASGSAFQTGYVVTVTVPPLTISDGLLAIGDEWAELRLSTDEDGPQRASVVCDG